MAVITQPKENSTGVIIIEEDSDDDVWEEYQPGLCGQKNHPMYYEHRVPHIIFANYLGFVEILACVVVVVNTETYYLVPQMLILLVLNIIQLYDYFLGFVLSCYTIFFETVGIIILVGLEKFKEGFSFIYYFHPRFTENQHFAYVICVYAAVFWGFFRFFVTRRALDYVCAVRYQIKEAESSSVRYDRKKPVEALAQM